MPDVEYLCEDVKPHLFYRGLTPLTAVFDWEHSTRPVRIYRIDARIWFTGSSAESHVYLVDKTGTGFDLLLLEASVPVIETASQLQAGFWSGCLDVPDWMLLGILNGNDVDDLQVLVTFDYG